MKRLFWILLFLAMTSAGVASFTSSDVVYFQNIGYTVTTIGLMYAVFNIAVSVAELPFSVYFDRFSAKFIVQLGNGVRMAAFAIFFFNPGVALLFVAQALAGIGVAATSGTTTALVVNEVATRSPASMVRSFSRIGLVSAAAAIIGGGIGIAVFSWRPPLIWICAIAFFAIGGFALTRVRSTVAETLPWSEYASTVRRVVFRRQTLVVVLSNTTAVAPFLLWQIRFHEFSIGLLFVGFVLISLGGLLAPIVLSISRVSTRFLPWIALLNLIFIACFSSAGNAWILAAAFVLHVLAQGIQGILADAEFHVDIDNSVRATAGSVVSLLDSMVVVVAAPVIGWTAQEWGAGPASFISCVICLVLVLFALWGRKRDHLGGETA